MCVLMEGEGEKEGRGEEKGEGGERETHPTHTPDLVSGTTARLSVRLLGPIHSASGMMKRRVNQRTRQTTLQKYASESATATVVSPPSCEIQLVKESQSARRSRVLQCVHFILR